MSLFLFKPHVTGVEGQVTSPDIIVDQVLVDGAMHPISILTSEAWQQVNGDVAGRAGYAVMALGGGALIGPALVLAPGPVVVARKAWRLNNLDDHIGEVTLNGTPLAEFGLPNAAIEAAGGSGDALPRGYMLIVTLDGDARQVDLTDPKLGRSLTHKVVFEDMHQDRWGDARPRPRYSVGPTQKDVTHYI